MVCTFCKYSSTFIQASKLSIRQALNKYTLGSWFYTNDELELSFKKKEAKVDITRLVKPASFIVNSITPKLVITTYTNGKSFSEVTYTFIIERKYNTLLDTLIIPVILQGALFIVILIVPIPFREKIDHYLTLLLTLSVYLQTMSDTLPHGDYANRTLVEGLVMNLF